tara:strand:- start:447 stop:1259 length:813 start_codon:yes stop_codon:yes gene_type:complete
MKQTKRILLWSMLALVVAGLSSPLIAQQDFEAILNQGAEEMGTPFLEAEEPDAVVSDAADGLSFYFMALQPSAKVELYVQEGEDYMLIRPSYNTFGSLHQLSKRAKLVFYEKESRMVEGKETILYLPFFEVPAGGAANEFVVIYRPINGERKAGKAYPLPILNLSPDACPYEYLTVLNPFARELFLKIDEEVFRIPARQSLKYKFKIRRRGAGYVYLAVAWRKTSGEAQKLVETRIGMFEGSRGIALPYLSADGSGEMGLYVHRDQEPQR